MTVRQALIGLAIILGVAAVFMAWLALASVILCFREHLFRYAEWPETAFLWWTIYDDEGLTAQLRSSAWLAFEILAVASFIGLSQRAALKRRQSPIYGESKPADDKAMAEAGILTEKRK